MTNNDNIQITNIIHKNYITFYGKGYDSKQDKYYQIYQIHGIHNELKLIPILSSEVASSSSILLRELAKAGADIPASMSAKNKLFTRLDEERSTNTNEIIPVTEQIGWLDDTHKVFVTRNDKIYGHIDGRILLVDKYNAPPIFTTSGSLDEWRENVAKYCQNNPNLLFSIVLALTPPLMSLMNTESGGFQLVGRSSIGKTISLKCAASVYGNYISHWNSTTNALVRCAVAYNDIILIIDETGQADDPKNVIDAIYKIAGGQGKNRLTDEEARYSWRAMLLSSSEKTIEELAIEAKKKLMLGQAVRLVDIKAESSEYGTVDDICGYKSSKEFVDMLNDSCRQYYGTAGDAYLQQLVDWASKDIEDLKKWINDKMNIYYRKANIDLDKGMNARIAKRFALVYAAGRLAKKFNILPQDYNILKAVKSCHERVIVPKCVAEMNSTTTLSTELKSSDCIMQVQKFIADNKKYFIKIGNESERVERESELSNIGIKYVNGKNKIEFLFLRDYFKNTICKDIPCHLVLKHLSASGLLLGKNGQTAQRPLTKGGNVTRVVAISRSILDFNPVGK